MSFDLITSATGGELLKPLLALGVPASLIPSIGDEQYSMADPAWYTDPGPSGLIEAWKREWEALHLPPWRENVSDCSFYAFQFMAWLRRASARQEFDDADAPGETSFAVGRVRYKAEWAGGQGHERPILFGNVGSPLQAEQIITVTVIESIWKVQDPATKLVEINSLFGIGKMTRAEYETAYLLDW